MGLLVTANKTSIENAQVLNSLSEAQKYDLATNHVQPPPNFEFPATIIRSFQRRFLSSYLKRFPWMAYSLSIDAAYCFCCCLMAGHKSNRGRFVVQPFTDWRKLTESANEHAKLNYHLVAGKALQVFYRNAQRPTKGCFYTY